MLCASQMFSSIRGLYPSDTGSATPFPVIIWKISPYIASCYLSQLPWGKMQQAKLPWLRRITDLADSSEPWVRGVAWVFLSSNLLYKLILLDNNPLGRSLEAGLTHTQKVILQLFPSHPSSSFLRSKWGGCNSSNPLLSASWAQPLLGDLEAPGRQASAWCFLISRTCLYTSQECFSVEKPQETAGCMLLSWLLCCCLLPCCHHCT